MRNILYDALQYGKQVADIAAKHRSDEPEAAKPNKGEFLSGFYKQDRIKPVITLVLHFGANEWDGPLSLHEMMEMVMEASAARGEARGEMKKAKEMALSLAEMGMSIDKIAQAAKVSIELVQEWLSGKASPAQE